MLINIYQFPQIDPCDWSPLILFPVKDPETILICWKYVWTSKLCQNIIIIGSTDSCSSKCRRLVSVSRSAGVSTHYILLHLSAGLSSSGDTRSAAALLHWELLSSCCFCRSLFHLSLFLFLYFCLSPG